ncbi:16S rRNA (cytosine967-C5)-methyltransferase [Apostasia shenzhenica]|uniref:16S rRNA (Cytosine967-C5)-methyltransferase n=1 Tax=Apostasia shenzhenica TaxID=1088818 RepID=A0A2I0A7P8_9ASPA|nr:16S rRNA (cytosine967-C5)-methyltransferase [Apostasia shenzhenica]
MAEAYSVFFVSPFTHPLSIHSAHRRKAFSSSWAIDFIVLPSSSITTKVHMLCAAISSNTPSPGPSTSGKRLYKLNPEVSPHRAVSAVRLLRIEQGKAFADLLSDKGRKAMKNEMDYVERTLGFRTRDLEDRDVRLVTDIVGGAVRWKRYLDHLIMCLCNEETTFRNMEPLLLQILRIGFYEILKLGMPPYAVVDENVRLAKVSLRAGAGNLVNGVMRKLVLVKEQDSLPLPNVEGDERAQARALATINSHPVWMVRRWIKLLGQEEAVELMNWNNTDPTFSLRVSQRKGYTRADLVVKLNDMKVPHELSVWMDDFVHVQAGMQAIIHAGLLKQGLCSVLDESAGLVVSVVDPQPGETIIDCCAAPGGKALYMASKLKSQGTIWAVDINKGRLRVLKEASRLQNLDDIINTIHADIRLFPVNYPMKADKVLLDAPCSGLGVLSKKADLRWNRRLEDLMELKELQDELLDAAASLVKPGGVLVYSTCSIDPAENEARIEAFLLRHPEFDVDPVHRFLPPGFVTARGFYKSNPVRHSMDGSFAARLIRSKVCFA